MELLDDGSFNEIGKCITNQVVPEFIAVNLILYDRVITGYGAV